MFGTTFWKSALERAVKTAGQALLVAAGLGEPGASVIGVDWAGALAVAGAAAAASLLTSLVSAPVGPAGTPSLVVEQAQPRRM